MTKTRLVPEVDLDRDGKQTGFVRLFHSTHEFAYGFIPIPITVVRNGDGPTALFTAGNHGDEYEGQIAVNNLAAALEPEMVRGRVILLPMAKLPAAMAGRRVSPVDGVNLNRAFPGDPDGTVTRQIAHFIDTELSSRADLLIDLHSGGSSLMYTPCALASEAEDPAIFRKQCDALRAFGAPFTYIQGRAQQGQGGDQTLGAAAGRYGGVALGTELGGSGTLSSAGLAIAERGLRNLLVHLGVLDGAHWTEPPKTRFLDVRGPHYYVYAPEAGLFEPLAQPEDWVTEGQPAARLHFPESPLRPPVEIAFRASGMVMCKRAPTRTARGDCLFHLASDLSVGRMTRQIWLSDR